MSSVWPKAPAAEASDSTRKRCKDDVTTRAKKSKTFERATSHDKQCEKDKLGDANTQPAAAHLERSIQRLFLLLHGLGTSSREMVRHLRVGNDEHACACIAFCGPGRCWRGCGTCSSSAIAAS